MCGLDSNRPRIDSGSTNVPDLHATRIAQVERHFPNQEMG
jgi:hypothetical protein